MSKTLFVEFRGVGFWAYDVVSAVFLKHLIDAAVQSSNYDDSPWLTEAVEQWRIGAVVTDLGFYLDESWTAEQVTTVAELGMAACSALSQRDQILAEEIESWKMVDDERCFARGHPLITTASAIRLGQAVVQLLNGALPEPPPGTWWFFGTEESPPTLGRRT